MLGPLQKRERVELNLEGAVGACHADKWEEKNPEASSVGSDLNLPGSNASCYLLAVIFSKFLNCSMPVLFWF